MSPHKSDIISSDTILDTMSPHKIEYDEGLRQDMEQINFELELEAENDQV
jgi:hypothetical protein